MSENGYKFSGSASSLGLTHTVVANGSPWQGGCYWLVDTRAAVKPVLTEKQLQLPRNPITARKTDDVVGKHRVAVRNGTVLYVTFGLPEAAKGGYKRKVNLALGGPLPISVNAHFFDHVERCLPSIQRWALAPKGSVYQPLLALDKRDVIRACIMPIRDALA